jgi:hypothetical protein
MVGASPLRRDAAEERVRLTAAAEQVFAESGTAAQTYRSLQHPPSDASATIGGWAPGKDGGARLA